MREIKFRAQNFGGYWRYSDKCRNGLEEFFSYFGTLRGDDSPILKRTTLCQYTGLKDKSGKEIYEGDICTFWWNPIFNEPSDVFRLVAPVEYYLEWTSFCYILRKKQSKGKQLSVFDELDDEIKYVAVGSPISYGEEMTGKKERGEVEVIGNIYENPELLGDTRD